MAIASPVKPATAIAQESSGQRRPFLASFFSVLAWQIGAILLVELLLFCAGIGEEEIFRFDPELGTKHMCNKRVTWRSEGFSQGYLNDDGMREPSLTVTKPAGTYRIALLGDSMVESFQVPLEETFGQLLQKQLIAPAQARVQVLNFGTSGYSTVQQYLQLKEKVFKYHPDMVLACYSSQDLFENWFGPDEVVRNVRPVAELLPDEKLKVQTYYVRHWMHSPRAKVLQAIGWLREKSRIWGLLAAIDLDMSIHNAAYRCVAHVFTEPKAELKKLPATLSSLGPQACSAVHESIESVFREQTPPPTATFADTAHTPQTGSSSNGEAVLACAQTTGSDAPGIGSTSSQTASSQTANPSPDNVTIVATLRSLLREMKRECDQQGCQFLVEASPSRSALVPGSSEPTAGLSYTDERQILTKVCNQLGISMFDCEAVAEKLPEESRSPLFYTRHLTPQGHQFVAAALSGFLNQQMGKAQQ